MTKSTSSFFAGLLCAAGLLAVPVLAADGATAIATALVERRTVDATYAAQARIEAVREVTLTAQIAGRVTRVGADAGDSVRRGQMLVTLDAREAAGTAQANAASLAQAQAAAARARELFAQKFISRAALDQAEAAWKAAQGAASASDATLTHAQMASPISGLVAERHIEPGELASPGTPLLTIFDPAGLCVVASVPQYRLDAVRAARRARIELVESGRWLDVARVEVLPTIDPQSHTATVRLALPAGVTGIAPGMAVRAHLTTGTAEKLVVPQAAILRRGEVSAVYVMGEDGKARLRQVRLGETVAEGLIEVLAGVAAGERISLDPVKTGIRRKAVP